MAQNTNGGNFTVLIEGARLSYVNVFQPYEKTYCLHAIIPPTHPAVALIKEAQRKAAAFAWKDKALDVLTQLAAQDRLCLHSGDITKAGQDGYAGMVFVSANGKVKPKILVTRNGANVEIAENDPCAPYSGCYGNVIVDVWPQVSTEWGKRINAQLTGVQFTKHGDRFGGGRVAKLDEFGLAPTDADGPAPGGAPAGADSSVSSLV